MIAKKMIAKDLSKGQVIVYKDKVEVRLDKETVWLSLNQLLQNLQQLPYSIEAQ